MNEPASKQLRKEIHAVIRRYAHESDSLTVYQVLGLLEIIKSDLIEMLQKAHEEDDRWT